MKRRGLLQMLGLGGLGALLPSTVPAREVLGGCPVCGKAHRMQLKDIEWHKNHPGGWTMHQWECGVGVVYPSDVMLENYRKKDATGVP